MLVTTILTFFVIRYAWRYPLLLCVLATGFFFFIDAAFLSSAMLKVPHGGWFPLAVGAAVFVIMTTWRRGREVMFQRLDESAVPLAPFLEPHHAQDHVATVVPRGERSELITPSTEVFSASGLTWSGSRHSTMTATSSVISFLAAPSAAPGCGP